MPTIGDNRSCWNDRYDWSGAGEEWSERWGTSYMQWHGTILPRIRAFLPAHTILEIAPGFGRWTDYLKEWCTNLIVVDLSEKCIKACQERFADCSHIQYFVNDGRSLDMIQDGTADFIISLDSLVHAEDAVVAAYVSQFQRKLGQDGAAFIHHSNLGEYSSRYRMQLELSKIPKLLGALRRLRVLDDVRSQCRAPSMSARKVQSYSEENGLQCISQELVTWSTRRALIDCMSTIVKKESMWLRDNKVLRNAFFMKEARNLFNLSQLYDLRPRR